MARRSTGHWITLVQVKPSDTTLLADVQSGRVATRTFAITSCTADSTIPVRFDRFWIVVDGSTLLSLLALQIGLSMSASTGFGSWWMVVLCYQFLHYR